MKPKPWEPEAGLILIPSSKNNLSLCVSLSWPMYALSGRSDVLKVIFSRCLQTKMRRVIHPPVEWWILFKRGAHRPSLRKLSYVSHYWLANSTSEDTLLLVVFLSDTLFICSKDISQWRILSYYKLEVLRKENEMRGEGRLDINHLSTAESDLKRFCVYPEVYQKCVLMWRQRIHVCTVFKHQEIMHLNVLYVYES